ncbi:polyprenyl diphosphate synthase [Streptomyces sp. CG1]|uniref:polyprenyl diphosphate synthase n=1 Tax=Streptomyces sp. CG1 TaxID=1287523 RepID=UPI0034E1FC36
MRPRFLPFATARPLATALPLATAHMSQAGFYRRSGLYDPGLRRGFETCRRATRATGEIEYAVSLLLPPPLRIAAWALYGAVRAVDDLADDPVVSEAERAGRLEEWVDAFDAELRDGASADPVRQALLHTLHTWSIPHGFLYTLCEELRRDVHGRRFTSWQEWRQYNSLINTPLVLRTASLLLKATGVSTEPEALASGLPEAALAWQTMIEAVYLTDALVDLADDLARGHIPLPQEALDEAGVRGADLLARRGTPEFEAMVRRLAGRARAGFDTAAVPGVVHPVIGIALDAYAGLYRLRLEAVDGDPAALLHRRPALPRSARLRLLAPARARAALACALFPLPLQPGAPAASSSPTRTDAVSPADDVRAHAGKASVPPTPHPSGARPPRLPDRAMPRHVAVILDGNGRWATARGLPRTEGHRAGADALIDVVHGALEIGLKYLTVYLFSTENWKRSVDEVQSLMYEIPRALRTLLDQCRPLNVRVRWAGSPSGLPPDVLDTLTAAEESTRGCTGLTVTACVNYGGRAEITAAAMRLAQEAAAGRISPYSVSEHAFARYLHVPELPDVDLLLRTGGDQRTSNFLPWQATYAELVFLDTPWPETDRRDLWRAMQQYASRNRRYGSVPREPFTRPTGSLWTGGTPASPLRR